MTKDSAASTYQSILGGSDLLEWFGHVPSFHDAEIIELHLKRKGHSSIIIHTWNMTNEINDGYFVTEKHAVVKFSIDQIVELELNGFSHQNVIFRLELSRVDLEGGREGYELSMEPCFGLAGIIRAENVSVSYTANK